MPVPAKRTWEGVLAKLATPGPSQATLHDGRPGHDARVGGDARVADDAHVALEENAVEGHGAHLEAADEEHGGRLDPVRFYGPWTWVMGLVFGGLLVWMMFGLSDAI